MEDVLDCQSVVGTEEAIEEEAWEVEVYPNPSRGVMHFEFPVLQTGGTLQVSDMYGRSVAVLEIAPDQAMVTWNAEGLASGLYFFQVTAEGQAIGAGTLVVGE
jgi:hypothetical protein